jgi:hypothetical protein
MPPVQIEFETRRLYRMATMKKSTQAGLLIAAIAAGAIAAAATRSNNKPTSARPSSSAIPELAAASKGEAAEGEATSVKGSVLEVIQVPRYTYLRIGAAGQPGTWAAVNSAPTVKVGDSVSVVQAQAMTDFQSTALNRKFDLIYFGALAGKDDVPGASNPHAGMDMKSPHGGGAMPSSSGETNPHAQPLPAADAVAIGKVTKAKGELGHTVADIFAKRSALSGKTVRVRAVVVKSVPGVMGKTFVHVRDGSGSEKTADYDLTVTTQAQPQVGDTLLFEGKLATDVDLGAGYKYPAIVQDAQLITD